MQIVKNAGYQCKMHSFDNSWYISLSINHPWTPNLVYLNDDTWLGRFKKKANVIEFDILEKLAYK